MVKHNRVLVFGLKSSGKTTILEQLLYQNVTKDKKRQSGLWLAPQPNYERSPDHSNRFKAHFGRKDCQLKKNRHLKLIQIFHPTIEDTYNIMIINDKGSQEGIIFYDTGGFSGKSPEIPRHYLSSMDGFVLVYAVNNQESFNMIDILKRDIDKNKEKKDAPVIIIGTKLDLVEERQVDYSQVLAWSAKEKTKCYELSVFDLNSLHEPFIQLASKLNPPQVKSGFSQMTMRSKAKD
ncbi:NF-kappa-B inhibitor-interacting Ras-like protein 1 isoform X1 [Artemia franciscana]